MNRARARRRMLEAGQGPPRMLTLSDGRQIPEIIIGRVSRDLIPRDPRWSNSEVLDRYPTDACPAIIKIKDPAGGGDKYLVNPMLVSYRQLQQRGQLSPSMRKLLDDYDETLLTHPEIAAYISAHGDGLPVPPPWNMDPSAPSSDIAEGNNLPDLSPPFKNMNLDSAPSSDIASISG